MDSVKSIIDFPNELLIEIFTYLLPSDRRVASACCQRFLEIWLLDDFIEDRRLVFDECLLDSESEPGSVFLQSTRKYDKIVLNDVEIGKNINELWKKWGETVTSIEKGANFSGSIDWFTFKKLKEIKDENMVQIPDNVPHGLDRIAFVLGDGSNFEEDIKQFDHFLNLAKSIEMEDTCTRLIPWLSLQNQTHIEKFKFSEGLSIYELAELELQNLKHLIINQIETEPERLFENLEERFPKLEYLDLIVSDYLPTTNRTYLKALHVRDMKFEQSTLLNLFVNVEKLDLCFESFSDSEKFDGESYDSESFEWRERTCFFTHEKFLNPNLKELEIHFFELPYERCDVCFEKLTLAFPNLEYLDCGLPMLNQHLKHLQKNSPKLKRLGLHRNYEMLSFAHLPNLHDIYLAYDADPDLTSWPVMPHLRKLSIQEIKKFNTLTSTTAKIFEKMPHLEHLDYIFSDIDGDVHDLINEMTKPLKRLRYLNFICNSHQNYYKPEIIDILAQNCKYLQTIKLKKNNFTSESDQKILKEKMAKYWWIRSINDTVAYRLNNSGLKKLKKKRKRFS